jgi:hypothetical protein
MVGDRDGTRTINEENQSNIFSNVVDQNLKKNYSLFFFFFFLEWGGGSLSLVGDALKGL